MITYSLLQIYPYEYFLIINNKANRKNKATTPHYTLLIIHNLTPLIRFYDICYDIIVVIYWYHRY